MSFDRRAVETVLRRFALEAADVQWNFADQAGDVPQRPYGTIKVVAHEALGSGDAEMIQNGDQITERMREEFRIDVSFQAFGSSAMDILSQVKTYARRPSTIFGMKNELRLGLLSLGEVRDLAAVVSSEWEGRAQLDAVFTAAFLSDLDIDTVARVAISGAGSTQTVEVP